MLVDVRTQYYNLRAFKYSSDDPVVGKLNIPLQAKQYIVAHKIYQVVITLAELSTPLNPSKNGASPTLPTYES